MRSWWLGVGAALSLTLACVRLVSAPNPGGGATGSPCGSGTDCVTGICSDAVCCAESCGGARACNLVRSPGTCLPREAGDPCHPEESGTCGTLSCVTEGSTSVCCNDPCQDPRASCHTTAAPGRCVRRVPGDGCTSDGHCPAGEDGSGHCVDGVCCDVACDGLCRSCNQAGHVGTCTLVPDNTDPTNPPECGGACTACFGGVCLPALGGTDPKSACPMGLVCGNNAACGVPAGGACDGNNPCAEGACLLGACLRFSVEPLPFLGVGATSIEVEPKEIAVSQSGEPTLMWLEARMVGANATAEQLVLARAAGPGWRSHVLRSGGVRVPTALVGLGSYALALVGPGSFMVGCTEVPELCQVVGRWVQPDGDLGSAEVVWAPPFTDNGDGTFTPQDGPICAMYGQAMEDGRVLVLLALGSPGYSCLGAASVWNLHLLERLNNGTWHNPLAAEVPGNALVTDTFGIVTVKILQDAYVVVDLTRDERLRATLFRPGEAPQEQLLSEGCSQVRSAFAPNESGWPSDKSYVWMGGRCRSPARGLLARLSLENGQLSWTAAVFPAAPDTNTADVVVVLPMGGAGRDTVRLAQLYSNGFLSYGTYSGGVFSREVVPITSYANVVQIYVPLVGSTAAGEHIFFSAEYDLAATPAVPRYPFAVRVRE